MTNERTGKRTDQRTERSTNGWPDRWTYEQDFLDAPLHLYMRLCPSVGPSVRRSVPSYFRRCIRPCCVRRCLVASNRYCRVHQLRLLHCHSTAVQNDPESRCKYWATHLFAHSLLPLTHLLALPWSLCSHMCRIHSFAHSFTPELVGK